MPSPLIPDAAFEKITDITPEWLRKKRIRGLVLDLDNTLAAYGEERPPKFAAEWISGMLAEGFGVVVLSNNHEARVKTFCTPLGVRFLSGAGKPFKSGYLRAAEMLGLPPGSVAVVGDQIFTDVWGAKRCGMTAVIVDPVSLKGHRFYRLRRLLEKPLIRRAGIAEKEDGR